MSAYRLRYLGAAKRGDYNLDSKGDATKLPHKLWARVAQIQVFGGHFNIAGPIRRATQNIVGKPGRQRSPGLAHPVFCTSLTATITSLARTAAFFSITWAC